MWPVLLVHAALLGPRTAPAWRPCRRAPPRAPGVRCCDGPASPPVASVAVPTQWQSEGGAPWMRAPISDYRYLGRSRNRFSSEGRGLHTPRYTSRDWARNILTLPMSRILRRIRSPLAFNLFVSLGCLAWHCTVGLPVISAVPHTLLGSALGLLLVFRTNTAYDRYWEARKRWGEMVDEARAYGSLACTVLPLQHAEPLLSLIASFPWVLKNHLRLERPSRPLKRLLSNEMFEALTNSENQPLFLLAKMRSLTHASKVKSGREGVGGGARHRSCSFGATRALCG